AALPLAGGCRPPAGCACLGVADRAVVDRQRPGRVDLVVDRDAGGGAGADVVGDDHVGQGQVGVALVADAAAVGGGVAVLDGEALHRHRQRGGGDVGAGLEVGEGGREACVHGEGAPTRGL